jgi:ferredoxin-NADP reductase
MMATEMAAVQAPRIEWQRAEVRDIVIETYRVKSLLLHLSKWRAHLPGQHVDIRLTAEDGYQAQRSYSIASAPEDPNLVLTVERLEDGEVSPYLVDELRPGDELELRGPIGGYFVWEERLGGPLLLVGGGSGIVPLRAILRHRIATVSQVEVRVVYSSRSLEQVIYRDELLEADAADGVEIRLALTREWPPGWSGHRGRITQDQFGAMSWAPGDRPLIYVCGPTGFVQTVSEGLVGAGHDPGRIRTERFGPTGT